MYVCSFDARLTPAFLAFSYMNVRLIEIYLCILLTSMLIFSYSKVPAFSSIVLLFFFEGMHYGPELIFLAEILFLF